MTAKYSAEWWEKVASQPSAHQQPGKPGNFASKPFIDQREHEREPDQTGWTLLFQTPRQGPPNQH